MQCSRCGKEAVIVQPYSGVALCTVHAARDLEAKARRRIRKCGGIASGERLYVESGGDAESFALSVVLAAIIADRRDVSFVFDPADATAMVTADTLDDCAQTILRLICQGDAVLMLASLDQKILAPLSMIPRAEVYLYADHYGWTGSSGAEPSDSFDADIRVFLENFSADHPSAAYALMQIRDALPPLYLERINHAL